MGVKIQQFNQIQGMNLDLSPSKRTEKLAYEIKNMRITIEDNNTLMSWENEKGTKEIYIADSADPTQEFIIEGTVLGSCVLNDKLVLFAYLSEEIHIIYGINFKYPTPLGYILYVGNLNFKLGTKFETLGVYENINILKIYWLDGINQARMINIAKDVLEILNGPNTQFDFLPTDNINTRVSIEKVFQTGRFKAGTIQYAFNYYNLYGALTNLFYVSPIHYAANLYIGIETDKSSDCAFKITISNINPIFDFVRIYSIFRASEDTEPQVSLVTEINLSGVNKLDSITFVDVGDKLTSISYSELLFLNNARILPSTMDSKDNTLFLGNFSYDSVKDAELKEAVKKKLTVLLNILKDSFKLVPCVSDHNEQFYPYTLLITKSSDKILGFKGGETYFFGCVVLDKYNRWTSVIPIGAVKNYLYPKVELVPNSPEWITYIVLNDLSTVTARIQTIINNVAPELEYKAVKYVITAKSEFQRNIICLGIVAPTVYCYENRALKITPFSQSSWFFRPIMLRNPMKYNKNKELLRNDLSKSDGQVLEYRHLCVLPHLCLASKGKESTMTFNAINTAVEIQCNDSCSNFTPGDTSYNVLTSNAKVDSPTTDAGQISKNLYGVDLSIITLHSPDIEFNSAVQNVLDRSDSFEFNIVGHTVVKSTVSDYQIDADNTSYLDMEDCDESYQTLLNLNKVLNSFLAKVPAASLVCPWGIKTNGLNVLKYSYCQVFPWQRSTSLNEQAYKVDKLSVDDNVPVLEWTVPLKTKVMSNLRFCMKTIYRQKSPIKYKISTINTFTPTTKLVRIANLDYLGNNEITYYGNIDTVVTKDTYTNNRFFSGKKEHKLSLCSYQNPKMKLEIEDPDSPYMMGDPIRMKYNSTSHVVFGFSRTENGYPALPYLKNYIDNEPLKFPETGYTLPTWLNSLDGLDASVTASIIKALAIFIEDAQGFPSLLDFYTAMSLDFAAVLELLDAVMPISGEELVFLIQGSRSDQTWISKNWMLFKIYLGVGGRPTATEVPKSTIKLNSIYDITTPTGIFQVYKNSADELNIYTIKDTIKDLTKDTVFKAYQPEYDSLGDDGIFFIGEFKRKDEYIWKDDDSALLTYYWLAASDTIYFDSSGTATGYGDVYFLRYDCLKTYPLTMEDPNQIVDIASFMVETYVNIDGRWDRNRGLLNNNDVTNTNFNKINKAYCQKDKFDYSYLNNNLFDVVSYPNSVMWTLTKNFGESIDSWTHLTSTSILHLDGDLGILNKLLNFLNTILFFLSDGVGYIKYNENVALSSSESLPVELANSGKVDGKLYFNKEIGCQNKDTIAVSKNAVYFIDGNTKTIYQITSPLALLTPNPLSDNSFETFMRKLNINKAKTFYNRNTLDIYFEFLDNTVTPSLTYNESTNGFTSFYDYRANFIESIGTKIVHILNEENSNIYTASLWYLNLGKYNYFYTHALNAINLPDNKYSSFYMTIVAHGGEAMYDKIWDNVEFRSDTWSSPGEILQSFKTFDWMEVWNEYQYGDTALVNHLSSDCNIGIERNYSSTLRKKFRIWRANVPRALYNVRHFNINGEEKYFPDVPDVNKDANVALPDIIKSRDRIRNPWTYIKLERKSPNTDRTVLHDMVIHYYV